MAGPENRTGPDGRPVFEPPEGSRLTASAPLARISAISCERTKDVAVPLLSLGNNPSERGVPPGGTIQTSRTLALKSRGGPAPARCLDVGARSQDRDPPRSELRGFPL